MTSTTRIQSRALAASLVLLAAAGGLPVRGQISDESAAQRLLLEAQRFEQQGDSDGALEEYEVLISEFPTSSLAPAALLQSAQLRAARGETDLAFTTAQRLIDGYGRDPAAAAAWVLQGEVRRATADSLVDLDEARALFRRVPLLYARNAYPDLEARSQALVRAGEISALLDSLDEAAAAFIEAVEDERVLTFKARARLELASVWLWHGEWPAAAEVLQRVLDAAVGSASPEDRAIAHFARERLTLVHRLRVRPLAGQRPWTRSQQLGITGLSFKGPTGVAAHDDGRLLVIDDSEQAVLIGAKGEVIARGSWRGAEHPFFGFDGRPYVTVSDAVQSPGGTRTSFSVGGDKPRTLDKIRSGQRGVFGEWIIADRAAGGVARFARDGRFERTAMTDQLGELEDMARDAQGRLYLLDRKNRTVVVTGPDGSRRASLSLALRKPEAIDVDLLGNVYVLDRGEATVTVLANDGTPVVKLGPVLPGGTELRSPQDLAVDGAGRLYIADAKLPYVVVVE